VAGRWWRGRVRPRLGVLAVALVLAQAGLPASAGPSEQRPATVRAYFFGDSLMAGTGASPRRPVMARVAAARLGWEVDVDAWGGTGYTTTGRSPGYLERLRRAGSLRGEYDVVLLEGGTNDARVRSTPAQVRAAVREVVAHVRARQPRAQVVLMGAYDPPAPGRVDPHRTTVDRAIEDVAGELGLPFFSPISSGWTLGQRPTFLDEDRLHPSTRGYGVMGARLADELAALVASGRISQSPHSASSAP
jgi:lysophospholipase L1-like esterase